MNFPQCHYILICKELLIWEAEPLKKKVTKMHAGINHASQTQCESRAVVGKLFSVKVQVVNILGFVGRIIATTQLLL